VTMPYGTDLTKLKAMFVTTGEGVYVEGNKQTSEITENNFTDTVLYEVRAVDGKSVKYKVTVTVSNASAKAITKFSFLSGNGNVDAIINETTKNISVKMLFGTKLAELTATFITTGDDVYVEGNKQISEITENNFTDTVFYEVRAADKTAVKYKVTVIVPLEPFVPYPKDCEGATCECMQDTTTGDVWTKKTTLGYQNYNKLMTSPGGYISMLNNMQMCGFDDYGWDLPTKSQFDTMKTYVLPVSNGSKWDWFNNRGFSGISNHGRYLGQCLYYSDCSNLSATSGRLWFFRMSDGVVSDVNQTYGDSVTYAWGVHSKP